MAIQLKVPSLGESITEATLGAWLKAEGDPVQADEPLVEVESEKATVALPSPAAGVLRRVLRKSGDTVAVGEVIGELDEGAQAQSGAASPFGSGPMPGGPVPRAGAGGDGVGQPLPASTPLAESVSQADAPEDRARTSRSPAAGAESPSARAVGSPTEGTRTEGPPTQGRAGAPANASAPPASARGAAGVQHAPVAPGSGPRRAPPSARRLMAEHGLDSQRVEGSGPGGQVRKEDVVRALDVKPSAPAPAPGPAPAPAPGRDGAAARERIVPMTSLRRTVARRLVEAQHTAAILTTFNEVDMTRVLALREKHGESFLARHGVKLGFMSFFLKAAVEGLRAFPAVNAEIRGTDIVYKDHYDIGVAVGGGKGLVVPVVRDADALSFAELEKTVAELAKRAKDNRITMDDLAGGTFTISNGGIYGSLLSTPILNPPQSGILGLHKIEKRAVVGDGDQITVRPMMYLALSYDHRIIDGREAVQFLIAVKNAIEDPERMLLEV
jgi:2-oxoglutarate dehydrogenase E2 component (dihydrolipoamide succinyltransferase)